MEAKYSMLYREGNNNYQSDFDDATTAIHFLKDKNPTWAVVVDIASGIILEHWMNGDFLQYNLYGN